jgi:hypothetical protein
LFTWCARDWTRTSTSCDTRPSSVHVYQFHHPGREFEGAKLEILFNAESKTHRLYL